MAGSLRERDGSGPTDAELSGLFFLVLLMWIFGIVAAFLWVIGPGLSFFGATATSAQIAQSEHRAGVATLVAFGLGLVMTAYASWLRRFIWATVFAVVALVTAAVFSSMGRAEEPAPPAPSRDHVPCYSGSNDCPGG